MGPVARCRGYRAPGSPPRGAKARPSASSFGSRAPRSCCRRAATPPLTATSSTRKARAAQAGPLSALSGAVRATRGAARAARHSPRLAVQRQSRLANTAHTTSRLLTRQQSAAPACSGRCGAAAPPPRPVHGAGERRHGLPPAAGGAHFPKEAQDAPSAYAALRSAAYGPRHAKPTLSLPERLSEEGLASAYSPPPRPCPPPGRASNARGHNHCWNCVSPLFFQRTKHRAALGRAQQLRVATLGSGNECGARRALAYSAN